MFPCDLCGNRFEQHFPLLAKPFCLALRIARPETNEVQNAESRSARKRIQERLRLGNCVSSFAIRNLQGVWLPFFPPYGSLHLGDAQVHEKLGVILTDGNHVLVHTLKRRDYRFESRCLALSSVASNLQPVPNIVQFEEADTLYVFRMDGRNLCAFLLL